MLGAAGTITFPKGELEQLHHKMRAPRIPADRKLGNKSCSAPTCIDPPVLGSHHARVMAGVVQGEKEGKEQFLSPCSHLDAGQLQALSSDPASLGYLGISLVHPASSLTIAKWQKQK